MPLLYGVSLKWRSFSYFSLSTYLYRRSVWWVSLVLFCSFLLSLWTIMGFWALIPPGRGELALAERVCLISGSRCYFAVDLMHATLISVFFAALSGSLDMFSICHITTLGVFFSLFSRSTPLFVDGMKRLRFPSARISTSIIYAI